MAGSRRYRFGIFEADPSTGELRRQGVRVKLNAQPFQLLILLLERPGELLTREEIARVLWPEGTFVDYEHGVNSAINRIREAIGDTAGSPRFVETLARRGYRFIAPVEALSDAQGGLSVETPSAGNFDDAGTVAAVIEMPAVRSRMLANPQELPRVSATTAQTLFILLQVMYVGFYVGALANLGEIQDLVAALPYPMLTFVVLIVTAALLIPVRAFVITGIALHAPGVRGKFLWLWRFLMPLDELWALSPFLLLHHINFGLALAGSALLAWLPFVQRSLVLMGAGGRDPQPAAPVR